MKLVSSSKSSRMRGTAPRGRDAGNRSSGVSRNSAQHRDVGAINNVPQYRDNDGSRNAGQQIGSGPINGTPQYRESVPINNTPQYRDNGPINNTPQYRESVPINNTPQYRDNGVSRNASQQRDNTAQFDPMQNQRSAGVTNRNGAKTAPVEKSHSKTIIVILLVIIVGFSALFVSLGFYVGSLDTVFPNVWADGIKVSGMTLEEATQALIDAGYERNAEGISVTIVFPDETNFSVSGNDVGLALNASEAALTAFEFGRDDTFFRNEITYIRALFNRTDLNDLSNPDFDESPVRELVAEYTEQFNGTLLDSFSEVKDDGITILKGTGLQPARENSVFELAIATLLQAVETNEHLTASYIPERNTDDTIDLQFLFNDRIHMEPVSSWYDPEINGATESVPGRTFDLEKAIQDFNNAEYGSTIFIPIEVVEPLHSKEFISGRLFNEVLAESKTTMSANSNRIRNIEIAAGYINETVLEPGQVFSFNEVVGRRTTDRGFLMAGVFQNGLLVDGVGGGICQMSSTLYDAVLHTQLDIVERRAHGFRVTYLPPGNDATVAYDSNTDFKFRNSTQFPMRIYASINGRELSVRLVGTRWDDTAPDFLDTTHIEIETVIVSETPVTVIDEETEELFIGERVPKPGSDGIPGVAADTFKLIYASEGGELLERVQVGRRSTYRMQPRVTLVGIRPHDEHNPFPEG